MESNEKTIINENGSLTKSECDTLVKSEPNEEDYAKIINDTAMKNTNINATIKSDNNEENGKKITPKN